MPHERQSSFPPPYQTYTSYEDEAISPTSDILPPNPYLEQNNYTYTYQAPPNYTTLPAFGSPRKFSERLHRLMESREQPLYLQLETEEEDEKQQLQIVYLDEKSAYDASMNAGLPQIPIDEEAQLYDGPDTYLTKDLLTYHDKPRSARSTRSRRSRRGRRCSSSADYADQEISWLTFAGVAAVLFLLVCSCSFFVAWTAGIFTDKDGLLSHMHVSSEAPAGSWKGAYREFLDVGIGREHGFLTAEETSPEELAAMAQLSTASRWADRQAKSVRKRKSHTTKSSDK